MKNTLCQMFLKSVEKYGNRPALKIKGGDGYRPTSYVELHRRVMALATGLAARGIQPRQAVGLIADNRPEWILADLACLMNGALDVPRGSDSTVQELTYILRHSDAVATFVEDAAQLEKILSVPGLSDQLRFIAVMDPAFDSSANPLVTTLRRIEEEGAARLAAGDTLVDQRARSVTPDDLATIIYTSGTTGEPKGVMLKHRNLMHNVRTAPPLLGIGPEDRFLTVLPPWHSFERIVEYVILSCGASMAYSTVKTLGADMLVEKPTYIASVPRIWEGIYFRVTMAMAKEKPAKQKLFRLLLEVSKHYLRASRVLSGEDTVYHAESAAERLMKKLRAVLTMALYGLPHRFAQGRFGAIRARTGGCLIAAVSGGGALPGYVDEFFAAVGLTVLEGYGLTETSPVLAIRYPGRRVLGTVGPLLPETEAKIVDDHNVPLPRGEKGLIKVRGEQVMAGYYKRDELTAATIDPEGWLDTGDLGRFTVSGELSITGRAKDTIVLMGGENVEPQPIEDKITESPCFTQVMVVGQDKKVLAALVVPNEDYLREHFKKAGRPLAPGSLASNSEVMALLKAEIGRLVSEENGFKPFEKVARLRIIDADFQVGAELTHTLKKKRNFIYEKYRREIDELYQ